MPKVEENGVKVFFVKFIKEWGFYFAVFLLLK